MSMVKVPLSEKSLTVFLFSSFVNGFKCIFNILRGFLFVTILSLFFSFVSILSLILEGYAICILAISLLSVRGMNLC